MAGASEQVLAALPQQRGKRGFPHPHPIPDPRDGQILPHGKIELEGLPTGFLPRLFSEACKGQRPAFPGETVRATRRGALQHFFFSGELRISVTRGPHGRAMPPAPSHYPPARPAALTRQSHQKQLARVCSERPEVCKTDSAVLHFSSLLARVFIAAEGTAGAGAPSWPSLDNSSARQNA